MVSLGRYFPHYATKAARGFFTSGSRGFATSGTRGFATSGSRGFATSGPRGFATSGSREFATSGSRRFATSGSRGFATSGPRGFATSGPRGFATSGTRGFATSGSRGFATSGRLRSRDAPSFSSSGDTKTCVTKLAMPQIATLILTGKPNRPRVEELNLNVDEFGEGAKGAIEVVTRGIAEGDYTSLEGLVTQECIEGLMGQHLNNLSPYQKDLLAVNQSDIFFSMLAETKIAENSAEILFVTFSLPQLGECKMQEIELKKEKEEFNSKMKEAVGQAKDGTIDGDKLKEIAKDNVREFKESVASQDSFNKFEKNEILIGNYRFVRDDPLSNWTISEICQVNSIVAWPYIFKSRWKGRVGVHLKMGVDFYKVLRYEYFVNWISIMFVANIWFMAAANSL